MSARIFVLFGQYGVAGTLPQLAERLGELGVVSTHQWNDPNVISSARTAKERGMETFFIGYSLGANQVAYLTWPLSHTNGIIGYDPSRLSPLARGGQQSVNPNCKHAVCYYNPSTWFYGGAQYVGHTVETVRIHKYHLTVPFDQSLHDQTYRYISAWHNQ